MNDPVTHYNRPLQIIHWLTAIVVFAMFAVGLWMVDLSYFSRWYHILPHWHKSVGLLLAGLTIIRIVWKLRSNSPQIEGSKFERRAAKLVHKLLYLNLMVIFISGYLISTADGRGIAVFNWFTVPSLGALFPHQTDIAGNVHFYAAWFLIIMVSLHALAALKHHFINKDNTLRKMTGAKK